MVVDILDWIKEVRSNRLPLHQVVKAIGSELEKMCDALQTRFGCLQYIRYWMYNCMCFGRIYIIK